MIPADNFGIHRAKEDRTQGQVLSDFLQQLEDYTATVLNFINI